ncbi:MAG: EAL domain-containing protein [Neptuniibacter sp.]
MNKSLLLVDDETSILRSLKRLFHREGFQVKTANSAEQALELFEQEHFPVVLSDYRMPAKNGGELLKEIKAKNPDTLGMILSGYADFESVLDALNSGAVYKFLEKPWDDKQLLNEVNNAFENFKQKSTTQSSQPAFSLNEKVVLEIGRTGAITSFQTGGDTFSGYKETDLIGISLAEVIPQLNLGDLKKLCLSDEVTRDIVEKSAGTVLCIHSKPINHYSWQVSITRWTKEQLETERCSKQDKSNLVQVLESHLSSSSPVSLFYLNIKHFRHFNEALGHSQGDQLLEQITETLQSRIKKNAKLARLNGAEFICLIPGAMTEKRAADELKNLISLFDDLISFQGREVMLTFAAGYTLAPEDGHSFDQLVQRAKLASKGYKRIGEWSIPRYKHQANPKLQDRVSLKSELYKALERSEFSVVYQPKVSLNTGKILGAEALIRWQHAEKGNIAPDLFIPLAEATGQINDIGEWVLSEATSQSSAWKQQGLPDFTLAVNVSGRQLVDCDLVSSIAHIIKEVGLAPDKLELEVTETYLIQDIENSIETLHRLKKLGVKIALDDFGTGYSSLNYLNRLPIDTLKVDRSFIMDLVEVPEKKTLIKNLITLSHELGMKVVAEGVETQEQLSFLQQMNCDEMQGYFFSPPVTAEAFKVLLEQQAREEKLKTDNGFLQ